LLEAYNVQVFLVCHRWLQGMCWFHFILNQTKTNNFAENYHLDKEKVIRDNKNDTKHVNLWRCLLTNSIFLGKTFFASRIILLQKNIGGFKHVITFYYGKQQLLGLQGHVLNLQVWVVSQVVVNILRLVVQQCVLNQSWRYWFLLDALFYQHIICMLNVTRLLNTLWGDFPSLYSRFYKVIMHGSTNATNEGRIQM
jgi:hypothetical protein